MYSDSSADRSQMDQRARVVYDDVRGQTSFARAQAARTVERWRFRIGGRSRRGERPRRPIFIVGCPRSGTTLAFSLLSRSAMVRSLGHEGHALWNAYQHPRLRGWSSDRVTARQIQPSEPAFLYGAIGSIADSYRFLEKTPKNVMRIDYLAALFPDAMFVLVKRDGRAVVSSLIEGWLARRGISYRLPVGLELAEYVGRYWSYILPPTWQSMVYSSVADIAALQYAASYEIALADTAALPADSVVEVFYEELVSRPVDELRRILERLDLDESHSALTIAGQLKRHVVGAISMPHEGKWRERQESVDRILPLIAPTMTRLGYEGVP